MNGDIHVEFEGKYKGINYLGTWHDGILGLQGMPMLGDMYKGWRCGYVEIPKAHPWYKKPYMEINVDCHGGLTFGDKIPIKAGWFVGFDCNHYYDTPESCPKEYVERECKYIIDRLLEVESVNNI